MPEPTTIARDRRARRRAELIEDIEWMAITQETVPGAAARLRIRPGHLRGFLHRTGRRDLLAHLLANQDERPYAGPRAGIPTNRRTAA